MQSQINDRSTMPEATGDSYIVTGSIGPEFEPKLFKSHKGAMAYAVEICRAGRQVFPPYIPVIETRWASDMHRMTLNP